MNDPLSVEAQAVSALAPLLGSRRGDRAAFRGGWGREPGNVDELVLSHLRGELIAGAVHRSDEPVQLVAWDVDGATHKSQGAGASPLATVEALSDDLTRRGLAEPFIVTSKSGSGFHVYALMAEPVDGAEALRLWEAVTAAVKRPEIDKGKPYPGRGKGNVLALPFAGLTGDCRWRGARGSRAVLAGGLACEVPNLNPQALAEWPRSTREQFACAVAELPPPPKPLVPAPVRPAPAVASSPAAPGAPSFGREGDLATLRTHCQFVRYAEQSPASLSYDQWFSLGTVLVRFPGGAGLFEGISAADADRYRKGEPARKLATVQGAPRHCTNLGWDCPKLSVCRGIGIQSPAGLPAKLGAAQRKQRT